MDASHVGHHHPADHDVMEMRDNEVGVRDMNVDCQCRQEQAGETAYRKQPDETEGVQHRGRKYDRPFVHGCCPVEDLDGRRDCDQITKH